MLSQSWQLTIGIAITAFIIGGLSSVKFTPTLKKNSSNAQIQRSRNDNRSRNGSFSQIGQNVTRRANRFIPSFIQKENSRVPPGLYPTFNNRETNYDYTIDNPRRNPPRTARRQFPYTKDYY